MWSVNAIIEIKKTGTSYSTEELQGQPRSLQRSLMAWFHSPRWSPRAVRCMQLMTFRPFWWMAFHPPPGKYGISEAKQPDNCLGVAYKAVTAQIIPTAGDFQPPPRGWLGTGNMVRTQDYSQKLDQFTGRDRMSTELHGITAYKMCSAIIIPAAS
ncbi:hypothetical protein BDZ91DRAFT_762630 [Kalaharituber pfeilii]|nr:hypothetical protein BDZ91DRAFT_762630 [Kalaharituber pfeilii]